MNSCIKCETCLRDYKNKTNFDKHIRMNRCRIKIPDDVKCSYCSKTFSTKYNKIRHENKCELSRSSEIDLLKEELKSIRKEIKSSHKSNTNILNGNLTQNITNNTYICKFGEENMEHLTKKQLIYLFNRCFGSIPEFAKLTYFNKDVPENCNVYLPNIKDKYACFFNGTKWEMKRKDEIIDNIYETAEAFLIEKFDDLKEGLGKDTLTKYTRWLNEHTQDERENVAKEQIKLLLYNEKDMVIELRKKHKNGKLESCVLSFQSNIKDNLITEFEN